MNKEKVRCEDKKREMVERMRDMGCGCYEPKKTAKYVCSKCGKEEMREVKEGEEVKSCCGQNMVKKEK